MHILLHTIALEPARWTPQRTAHSIIDLLYQISLSGFDRVEVYEPHLTSAIISAKIEAAFRSLHVTPEILSSYLNLNPAISSEAQLDAGIRDIQARAEYYGFRRLRIFPGSGIKVDDKEGVAQFIKRLERLLRSLPELEVLLETHDGSLADDPQLITDIVRQIDSPSLGLLFQPTFFDPDLALRQFELQRPLIRHIHLQNRNPDRSFAKLADGVVPWDRILREAGPTVTATIEFVPKGICPVAEFDLAATLRQAQSEADYAKSASTRAAVPI